MRLVKSSLVAFFRFALGTVVLRGVVLGAVVLGGSLSAAAFAEEAYTEGKHYELLPIPVDTADPDTCEVVEVFSYMCIHCYNFDPAVNAWSAAQAHLWAPRPVCPGR